MCHGRIVMADFEARQGLCFQDYFAEALPRFAPLAARTLGWS